jgi:hypothetical protein
MYFLLNHSLSSVTWTGRAMSKVVIPESQHGGSNSVPRQFRLDLRRPGWHWDRFDSGLSLHHCSTLLCFANWLHFEITRFKERGGPENLLVSSSCPSAPMYQCGSHWSDFRGIWCSWMWWISVEKTNIWLKLDKNVGHISCKPKATFVEWQVEGIVAFAWQSFQYLLYCWQRHLYVKNKMGKHYCSRGKSGHANAPQYYVMRTLSGLLCLEAFCMAYMCHRKSLITWFVAFQWQLCYSVQNTKMQSVKSSLSNFRLQNWKSRH